MRFEWDARRNRSNEVKHGIDFDTAALVFSDPFHLSVLDRRASFEERWQTTGLVHGIVLVLVAHTVTDLDGEEIVRILRNLTEAEQRARPGKSPSNSPT